MEENGPPNDVDDEDSGEQQDEDEDEDDIEGDQLDADEEKEAEKDEENAKNADTVPMVELRKVVESNAQTALEGIILLPPPASLKAELHLHQQWGISWMTQRFTRGLPMILADQMGLGKTIQSIGYILQLRDRLNLGGPHLIVVPLSVLSNWLTEIERFAPSLRTVRFHGPKGERNRLKREEMSPHEFDIAVTTYEVAVAEATFLKKRFLWTSLIVDEGHRLKNAKSRLSERLRGISALSKIILTGTPIQNNMTELWALLHFLAPEIFTPACAELFASGFDPSTGKMDTEVLAQARSLLDLFMLRRVKSQVSIRLPNKRELTLLVPLTDRQKELYRALLGALDADTARALLGTATTANSASTDNQGGEGRQSEWRTLMNLLMQLRKLCNHTYLLDELGDMPDPYKIDERLVGGSGKLLLLDRLLPRLKVDGHRVLLFSQFTSTLDLLEDYCQLRNYNCARLDGDTSRVRRRLEVRRFNQPKSSLFIFLISTRAGGLGLNLATADTVVLYDSDW